MFCMILQQIQIIINIIVIGHLNDENLMAGIGMGAMLMNMVGNAVMVGLNGAVETLVAQSYGGDNLRQCGVYLNRGRLVVMIAFVPICLLLL